METANTLQRKTAVKTLGVCVTTEAVFVSRIGFKIVGLAFIVATFIAA